MNETYYSILVNFTFNIKKEYIVLNMQKTNSFNIKYI